MEFTTQVTDISIYNLDKNEEANCDSASVTWNCDIEAREWGIKSLVIYPVKILCSVNYEIWDKEKEEWIYDQTIDIDSGDGWSFETEGLEDKKISDFITPEDISIDFSTKTITVNF